MTVAAVRNHTQRLAGAIVSRTAPNGLPSIVRGSGGLAAVERVSAGLGSEATGESPTMADSSKRSSRPAFPAAFLNVRTCAPG